MNKIGKTNRQYYLAKIVFGVLLFILAAVLYFDRAEVNQLIFSAHWNRLIWAVIFTAASLFFASYGFYVIGRVMKLKIDRRRLFLVGFVTIAINALITSASTAAFSLRIILLKKKDVTAKEIFAASVFHSYFNLFAAIIFLPFTVFYLTLADDFPFNEKIIFVISSFGLLMIFAIATWLFFSRKTRSAAINYIIRLLKFFNRKYHSSLLSDFKEVLDEGALDINKKLTISLIIIATFLDWLFTLLALWACFWALGIDLPFGYILSGFFVGVVAGFISIIPGGIGVQEGSMAAIYVLFGVHFSEAIVAVLLFRMIYYIIPFIPAIFLYGGLLRKSNDEAGNKIKSLA
jgi:uncharacterized protein (TIRG00374 family)